MSTAGRTRREFALTRPLYESTPAETFEENPCFRETWN
jgi:hypothetical protein